MAEKKQQQDVTYKDITKALNAVAESYQKASDKAKGTTPKK